MRLFKQVIRWIKARQPGRSLYPEIDKAGGLDNALNLAFEKINSTARVAVNDNLKTLPFTWAVVEKANKFSQVSIAAKIKLFQSDFWRDGVCLAHAGTESISDIAIAIDYWLTQDIPTQALADKFLFVRPNDKAKAFDEHTEVAYSWNTLLTDDSMGLAAFVSAALEDEVLSQLFPFTSLYTLCFSRCTGYPYDTDHLPNVTAKQFGHFEVQEYHQQDKEEISQQDAGPVYVVTNHRRKYLGEGNAVEALKIVRANLPRDIKPARKGTAEDTEFERRRLILEGKNIHTIDGFHAAIKDLLQFPDYYGNNLDALWDCLTTGSHLPVVLVWKDFAISQQRLGEYADTAMNVFEEAASEVDGFAIEWK